MKNIEGWFRLQHCLKWNNLTRCDLSCLILVVRLCKEHINGFLSTNFITRDPVRTQNKNQKPGRIAHKTSVSVSTVRRILMKRGLTQSCFCPRIHQWSTVETCFTMMSVECTFMENLAGKRYTEELKNVMLPVLVISGCFWKWIRNILRKEFIWRST